MEKEVNFEALIDKIFEEQETKNLFFQHDQMLYSAFGQDGRLNYVSDSWCKCLGLTNEEIQKIPFSVLIHPDDVKLSMDAYDYFINRGVTAVKLFVNRYRRKDGSYAKIQWFEGINLEEALTLASALEIPEHHEGFTLYQDDYEPFNWEKK